MQKAYWVKLAGFLVVVLCAPRWVHADPVYGVVSTVTIGSGNGPATFPGQSIDFTNGGNPVPVTSYTSPVLSDSGSYTVGNSTVTGSATSWGSVDDGSSHGYATTNISGQCQTCPFATGNIGLYDIDWYDTISITGLSPGAPVDLLLTVSLDSVVSSSGGGLASVTWVADLGSTQAEVTNQNGSESGLTDSVMIHTTSGSALALVTSLQGSADVDNLFGSESATADASDTGSSYITVLTPGASYTTASGVGYGAPSAVPEPKSVWLVLAAIAAICFKGRRRPPAVNPVTEGSYAPRVDSIKRRSRLDFPWYY